MEIDKSLKYYKAYDTDDRKKIKWHINKLNLKHNTCIMEKVKGIVSNDSITIRFGDREDYEKDYYVEYMYLTTSKSNELINNDTPINLTGYYINTDDIDLYSLIKRNFTKHGIYAEFSFWAGDAAFDFDNFENTIIQLNHSYLDRSHLCFYHNEFNNCRIEFKNTVLNKSMVSFLYCKFINTNLSFKDSYANSIVSFQSIDFKDDVNLEFAKIHKLNIINCTIKSIIRVSGSPNIIRLDNTINQGFINIDWYENNIKNAIINSSNLSQGNLNKKQNRLVSKSIASDFLLLKENYRNQGQYEWEDAAYRAYMKYHTKSLKWLSRKGIVKKPFNFLFGIISGYGTRVGNIIATCIAVIIAFGFGYRSAFIASQVPLWKSMYFSTITFLTIGYGNLNPMEQGFTYLQCIFTGVEGFLGLLLMSLVTVTIVRKILR